MKITTKTTFPLALLPIIIVLSGCVVMMDECPPIYGADIKKIETAPSTYINVTRSELSPIPPFVLALDDLIANESLDSIKVELDRKEWNQTVELFEQLFKEEYSSNSWVIRYNERFYEILFWIMVC
ncbi:MAG: hypothetical protein ACFE95_18210 [Candidatus Hodarchaeota archaeon]